MILANVQPDEVFKSIRDAFNDRASAGEILILVAGAALLIGLLIWAARRFREDRPKNPVLPDYLKRAADRIGLNEHQVAALRRLAHEVGQSQPLALLLTPNNLRQAATRARSVAKDAPFAGVLNEISHRVFSEPLFPDAKVETPRVKRKT